MSSVCAFSSSCKKKWLKSFYFFPCLFFASSKLFLSIFCTRHPFAHDTLFAHITRFDHVTLLSLCLFHVYFSPLVFLVNPSNLKVECLCTCFTCGSIEITLATCGLGPAFSPYSPISFIQLLCCNKTFKVPFLHNLYSFMTFKLEISYYLQSSTIYTSFTVHCQGPLALDHVTVHESRDPMHTCTH